MYKIEVFLKIILNIKSIHSLPMLSFLLVHLSSMASTSDSGIFGSAFVEPSASILPQLSTSAMMTLCERDVSGYVCQILL